MIDVGVMFNEVDQEKRTAFEVVATEGVRRLFCRPDDDQRFYLDEKSNRWVGKTEGKEYIRKIQVGVWVMTRAASSKLFQHGLREIADSRESNLIRRMSTQYLVTKI